VNLSRLSIDQPVLAIVASIFILVVGAIAYSRLPVAEYPEIAPPSVVIQTQYPGASAQVAADTVATPIEQEVNGVDDMLYMYSQSTSDGRVTITVTFKLGTDPDKAQVLVRNAVSIAEPRLPEEVRRSGVTTRKNSPNLLMVVFLLSPDDTYDQLYISNYALRRVRDTLLRLDGIGDIQMYGARDYSMRLWLDPDKMAEFGLTATDLLAGVRSQNAQIAGGQIAEPPISDRAFQPSLTFLGRLVEPDQFENIIVKSSADGRIVRLKDIARVELGALSYSTNSFLVRKPAIALAVTQRPGSNALATMELVKQTMAELQKEFPKGLAYNIAYNPTDFIAESVRELLKTVYEAILLVVVVVILFLQRWRAAIIPIIAIPVSLVGTFAVMAAFGLSVNNLTLFGLVLAVGIVVDDAIVVVENVERHLSAGINPLEAARRTMDEVGTALISIALVLAAVFVPTAFLGGISGQFFRQFAIAIAVATVISCFNSLTLSPALSSLILKSHTVGHEQGRWSALARPFRAFFGLFNRGFDRAAELYGRTVRWATAAAPALLAVYAALIAITAWAVYSTPRGFIPAQDRGYVIVAVQLPSGSSLARTTDVVRRAEAIILDTPGVATAPTFAGLNGATRTLSPSAAAIFPVFAPHEERLPRKLTAERITADLRARLGQIEDASVLVLPPPAVPGIGTGGGFAMRLEDRAGRGTDVLAAATDEMVNAARADPSLTSVFTPFATDTPQLFVDIDRTRAQMLNVPIANVTEALETYFGSSYVNDFNILGRVYRVTAQADLAFRRAPEDLMRLKARNDRGEMVPIGSVLQLRDTTAPDRVPRYNLYPASEIAGEPSHGVSSTTALDIMTRLARQLLPDGISFEWSDLSYQESQGGTAGLYIFPLCVLFVYLALAAQYGSWTLPLAIILIVPMCLLAGIGGVRLMAQDVNVLTQIGFIVLVGLAAKNAILIVEFAKQQEELGQSMVDAVIEACRLRLRPILMTSFAFILGVLPLVISQGAGAEMRQAVGVAVFFGMIGVTLFGLLFTPVFYVIVRKLFPANVRKPELPSAAPAALEPQAR
jgi:hydrophobe/amphiphile efflux-1 (HAE1) family protein